MLTYLGSRSSRFRFFIVLLALVAVVGWLIKRVQCLACSLVEYRLISFSFPDFGPSINYLVLEVGALGAIMINTIVGAVAFYILFLVLKGLRRLLSR